MRIKSLDSLRGIAALAVAIFHFTSQYSLLFNTNNTTKLLDFKYGHYGVQLFFILSGFVIFMTIKKVKSPVEFLLKRFIRLYPIFWICIIITTIVTFNLPPGFNRTFSDFMASFTMVPILLGYRPIDGAYWSLIPELFFYFIMFILLFFKKIENINILGFCWISLFLACYFFNMPKILEMFLCIKFGYLFLTGINFFFIHKKEDNYLNHIQIFLCYIYSFLLEDYIFCLFYLLYILVFYLLAYGYLKFLNIKLFTYLGSISYSFYLLHQFIGYTIIYNLINKFNLSNPLLLLLTPLVLTLLLAIFISEIFEKPTLNYLNKILKKNYL